MDRRMFLGTLAGAVVGRRWLAAAADHRKINHLGVQLYTVRAAMEKDFEGTLAKVAAIGYREVEFAGLFNHPAPQVKAMLRRNGLVAVSSHVDYGVLAKDWPRTLEAAKIMGQGFIVCPWIEEKLRNAEGLKRVAETFNRAGEASRKLGIQFAYHNHDFEFQPVAGKLLYDSLLDQTDSHLVKMEMDLFWITKAGKDPLAYFDRYRGRFPLVHVKDRTPSGEMTEVGSGAIDWKRIFRQSDQAGIQYYIVEHDEPKSPFDSIRTSYSYLSDFRF